MCKHVRCHQVTCYYQHYTTINHTRGTYVYITMCTQCNCGPGCTCEAGDCNCVTPGDCLIKTSAPAKMFDGPPCFFCIKEGEWSVIGDHKCVNDKCSRWFCDSHITDARVVHVTKLVPTKPCKCTKLSVTISPACTERHTGSYMCTSCYEYNIETWRTWRIDAIHPLRADTACVVDPPLGLCFHRHGWWFRRRCERGHLQLHRHTGCTHAR